jgi:hypothetical protein
MMSSNNYATTATLSYLLPPADGSRPYSVVTGKPQFNWIKDPHVVDIENVRGSEDQYKLDNAGFQYGIQASKHTRFVDNKEIEQEYYPECVDIIKKITGASSAVIFDHTIRRRRPDEVDDGPDKRQPVSQAHVDQTTASSIARVHRHLPPDEAPALLKRRFQIINLWRPISHAALDWPLTLCDFRSVDMEKDLVPVKLVFADREGETFGVKYNAEQKWKYMRGMEPDQYVLIKCFDSVQDGSVAILTPHTGFQDPNSPEGAPLRESIEIRALVFYDN